MFLSLESQLVPSWDGLGHLLERIPMLLILERLQPQVLQGKTPVTCALSQSSHFTLQTAVLSGFTSSLSFVCFQFLAYNYAYTHVCVCAYVCVFYKKFALNKAFLSQKLYPTSCYCSSSLSICYQASITSRETLNTQQVKCLFAFSFKSKTAWGKAQNGHSSCCPTFKRCEPMCSC